MKKLLAIFRISDRQAAELDRALRRTPAVPPVDAALHQSIMRAVRAGANAAETTPKEAPGKLWLAMAVSATAAICLWLVTRPGSGSLPATPSESAQTLAVAQGVLDMGAEVSRSVPAVVVSPLSNELASVDHDIRNATQFVLATLP
ncbi:MAG TPA: hypothetical protein VH619_18835 [Verrucomicrobiae bacterium]|jgi:hypothetical protein|nr:hypothetical protein [Verrucomicrobiae bacterium]